MMLISTNAKKASLSTRAIIQKRVCGKKDLKILYQKMRILFCLPMGKRNRTIKIYQQRHKPFPCSTSYDVNDRHSYWNPASSVDKLVGAWRWVAKRLTLPRDCYRYDHKHNAKRTAR